MQDDMVIVYASRELRKNKKNYLMHKLELVAVLLHIKFSDHFNMEKGCKFSLIKEALGRANIAAYALRGSDINDDME